MGSLNTVKKFKFVSPGVSVKEIDKSQLPKLRAPIGPVVIGKAQRGPGLVPVTVNSFSEFVDTFGPPDRGIPGTDVWRGRRYYFSHIWSLCGRSLVKK